MANSRIMARAFATTGWTMYCPNCAMITSDGQRYCNSCGFDLKKVSKIVTAQRAAATGSRAGDRAVLGALAVMGVTLISVVISLIVNNLILEQGNFLLGIPFLLIIACALVVFYNVHLRPGRRAASAEPPQQLREPERKELPFAERSGQQVSVTEHTTDLLGIPPRRRESEWGGVPLGAVSLWILDSRVPAFTRRDARMPFRQ